MEKRIYYRGRRLLCKKDLTCLRDLGRDNIAISGESQKIIASVSN